MDEQGHRVVEQAVQHCHLECLLLRLRVWTAACMHNVINTFELLFSQALFCESPPIRQPDVLALWKQQ